MWARSAEAERVEVSSDGHQVSSPSVCDIKLSQRSAKGNGLRLATRGGKPKKCAILHSSTIKSGSLHWRYRFF